MEDRTVTLGLFPFQARLKMAPVYGTLCLQRSLRIDSASVLLFRGRGDREAIQCPAACSQNPPRRGVWEPQARTPRGRVPAPPPRPSRSWASPTSSQVQAPEAKGRGVPTAATSPRSASPACLHAHSVALSGDVCGVQGGLHPQVAAQAALCHSRATSPGQSLPARGLRDHRSVNHRRVNLQRACAQPRTHRTAATGPARDGASLAGLRGPIWTPCSPESPMPASLIPRLHQQRLIQGTPLAPRGPPAPGVSANPRGVPVQEEPVASKAPWHISASTFGLAPPTGYLAVGPASRQVKRQFQLWGWGLVLRSSSAGFQVEPS